MIEPKTFRVPLLLFCCALPVAAQPEAWDVVFLAIGRSDAVEVPEVAVEAVWRFALAEGVTEGELERTHTIGRVSGIDRLKIFRRASRSSRRRRTQGRRYQVTYRFRWRRFNRMTGSTSLSEDGTAVEVGFGRRVRTQVGIGSRHVLFVPVEDRDIEPELWSAEDASVYLAGVITQDQDWSQRWSYARALLRMPLARILPPPQRIDFIKALRSIPDKNVAGETFQTFIRGRQVGLPDLARMLRVVAGDDQALSELAELAQSANERVADDRRGDRYVPNPMRAFRDPLRLGFSQAKDPEIKGLAGWLLVEPHGLRRRILAPEVITPFFDLVEAGDAVLPGTPQQQQVRHRRLENLVAEKSAAPGLIVLAGGALAMGFLALLARRGTRRALF